MSPEQQATRRRLLTASRSLSNAAAAMRAMSRAADDLARAVAELGRLAEAAATEEP